MRALHWTLVPGQVVEQSLWKKLDDAAVKVSPSSAAAAAAADDDQALIAALQIDVDEFEAMFAERPSAVKDVKAEVRSQLFARWSWQLLTRGLFRPRRNPRVRRARSLTTCGGLRVLTRGAVAQRRRCI
jgi:hypothetical protein